MPKHIAPFNNANKPIVDCDDTMVPLCYFNRLLLTQQQTYHYQLADYESCVVVASGQIEVVVENKKFSTIGNRQDVFSGNPSAVYVPLNGVVEVRALSKQAEVFIAGGRAYHQYEAFAIYPDDCQIIQYGSDETKTHRRIKHILGQNVANKVDRLLVSELLTVGAGGWSGFPPHKHDTERADIETKFEEVYLFKFSPEQGFGAQFATQEGESVGKVHHIRNNSVFLIDKGYHPCVAAPGYQMYYFTIIVGAKSRSLKQYFHPDHEYQVHTIPGIKDMISAFK